MPRHFLGAVAMATALVAIATTASPAEAATTRAEYVSQVDQACGAYGPQFKKNGNAIVRLGIKSLKLLNRVSNADGSARKEILRKMSRLQKRITRAAQAFNGIFAAMVDGIAAVPAAPGDEAAVAQWVEGMRQYVDLSARGNRASNQGKLLKSLSFLGQALDALDRGGAAVQGFGISKCPTSSESPLF
jgi:hypothetical protein